MNLRLFLCLLLAGGLLTFCKKSDSAGTEATATVDPATLSFKRTENTVRIGIRTEPPGLNPILSTQASARYVSEMVFQTLNSQHPQTYAQVPSLASVADISKEADGGVAYAYVLDEQATWPNGMPITATDVIFSLKVVLHPLVASGAYRPYYATVTNIVTSPNNEKRFKVMTSGPYLLAEQALGSLTIYPEYAYDPEGLLRKVPLTDFTNAAKIEKLAESDPNLKAFAEFFSVPERGHDPELVVGSGPYRLVSWEEGQRITLERKPNYWGLKKNEDWLAARPESIIFEIIPDDNTMANALRDELVDVVVDMGVDQFKELHDDEFLQQRYSFSAVPSFKYFSILLNQQHPLFREVETRRAMAYLMDVDAMIAQIFSEELATRVASPVLPAKSYYHDGLELIPYNPERAVELLSAAGWTDTNGDGTVDKEIDGKREELSFEFLIFPSPAGESVGTLVAEWAKAVGVDIRVVRQDIRALYGELNKGNFSMAITGFGFDPNPDDFTQVWASTSVPPNGTNRGGFNNPEADQLIKQIRVTLDDASRAPLYRRFQEIVYENQPMIFLFSPKDRVVVSKRFDFEAKSIAPNVSFNALAQEEWNQGK